MNPDELKYRTKQLALKVIRSLEKLPKTQTAEMISRQLIRSATSVGANYRAACCGKSRADFIAKMGIVQEEADESLYWLEILYDLQLLEKQVFSELFTETEALLKITVSSIKMAKSHG